MSRTDSFTAKEIAVSLNNTVAMTLRPASKLIEEDRLRRLNDYSSAILAPLSLHVDEGAISPEELVCILVSAALLIQQLHVLHSEHLPQTKITKTLFEKLEKFKQDDKAGWATEEDESN